jgi:cytochrome b561
MNETAAHHRYTAVAILLHWAIAAFIIFNLAVGFFMEGLAPHWRSILVFAHISSGMTVLALSVARVLWRLAHRPPPFPADMQRWERTAAHAGHSIIYFLMFAMPLTGWAIISAHPPRPGAGANVWGLFVVPPIGPVSHLVSVAQKSAHEEFVQVHSVGGWIFLGLLALHVLAALKHQFYDKHAELARMGVGRAPAGNAAQQQAANS